MTKIIAGVIHYVFNKHIAKDGATNQGWIDLYGTDSWVSTESGDNEVTLTNTTQSKSYKVVVTEV